MALHNPSALSPANQSLAKLPGSTLRDFAATPRTGLPVRVKPAQGMKPAMPTVKPAKAIKPLTPHTGFRSVMSGDMPRSPGVRWR